MLEEFKTTEVLPVRIFQQAFDNGFVAFVEGMFEIVQANKQADRQAGAANVFDIKLTEVFIKDRPVDGVRQTVQRMTAVQDLIQP